MYCYYLLIFVTNSKEMIQIHQYENHQTSTRSVNGFISQVINRINKYIFIYIYIFASCILDMKFSLLKSN